MKTGINIFLSTTFCLAFFLVRLQAQQKSLTDLLIGEWSMSGQSIPQINDTITLTRKLSDLTDHPRWIFDLPDKLQQHYIFKDKSGQASAEANYGFEWYYDSGSNLLRIRDDKTDQYFKINSNNNQVLKLKCVK